MRHEFAFYVEKFSEQANIQKSAHSLIISSQELAHRLSHVIRMQEGGACILFDEQYHANALLKSYQGKKSVEFRLTLYEKNRTLSPEIIAFLPILRREAFEDSCYSLVELGAHRIQPVITQKIQRSWGGAREMERLRKIIIAASEQSKNYAMAELHEPITFEQALTYKADAFLYADPDGASLWNVIESLRNAKPAAIAVMIGPEGDLTTDEKKQLVQAGVIFCALTTTILRSYQAMNLMVGSVRSLV